MNRPTAQKLIFIVAPDGGAGGGMGRVKDYIVQSPPGNARLVPLITRDGRGAAASLRLLAAALAHICSARVRGEVALVHVNFGDKGSAVRKAVVVLMSCLIGVPTILHLHAVQLERQYDKAPAWLRWLIRLPFRAATCNIVLGERWRTWLVEHLDVSSDRVEVLWNGVPVAPEMERIHRNGDRPVSLLFLGNLIARKGVTDLLHALAAVPTDGRGWQARFAGGGDVEACRDLAASLGISDRVEFVGWVDQEGARQLVRDADMLALPSYEEGLPLVILEALGSGTAVICTPVGSIPEVLEDGRTALFVAPGDQAALARAIARLAADAGLRQHLCDEGIAQFRRVFSIEAFRTALFDIWRRHCGIDYAGDPKASAR